MRAIYSYVFAGMLILAVAAWLATGTLVIGGKGPGNGERPIVSLVEKDGGPLTAALDESGLLVEHSEEAEGSVDPHLTIAQRVAETSGTAAPAQSVRTITYSVRPMQVDVPLRGRTKAMALVSVMPETQGVVRQVHVDKGQKVAAGELICTLDQGTRKATVAQAEAALAQAQQSYDTNAALREKGLQPANSASAVEAALRAAQAGLENAKAELARTEVRTQIAGVVQAPLASVGSMLGGAAPCATIVQLDPMLFTGVVPEARVGYAKLGLAATIKTVTGQSVEGKVSYISSTADPATRSFAVEIEIPNADGAVLDGVTAEAIVNVGTAPAHLLPQSVLTLDDQGVLGVRAVDAESKVAFYPITIMKDTREGIWVTGLPAKVDVITVGQEFVQAGQTVKATNVTDAPAAQGETPAAGVAS